MSSFFICKSLNLFNFHIKYVIMNLVIQVSKVVIGKKYQIQCYKHDGKIHRAWDEAVLLEVNKDFMVFGNNKTKVTEAEGVTWRTKEPAIMYFFKNKWYNIIVQMKKDGIYYYCNIATPYIIEEDTIKYIDYDLDLRIFPKGDYKILDKLEYEYHKKKMNYSDDLDLIIKTALSDLIGEYKKNVSMFNSKINYQYLGKYLSIKNKL